MSKNQFIVYGKPCYGKEEISSINKVVKSYWIGTGKQVNIFEKSFARYKHSKFATALNSCTAALHLSILSLNPKQGDEVITTPMTFASTVNSIILAGCKPVLVDINRNSLNIDENLIEKKITKKTIAIILVHFAGLPCNMQPIIHLANKYKIKIIEDCAHAIESKYKNKSTGTFGHAGCFSFYSNKNITTGEGGMLICKEKKIDSKFKVLRLHGMSRDAWKRFLPRKKGGKWNHYDVIELGHKYNMIDLNAAFGIEQLKKINSMYKKRERIYKKYTEKLKDLPLFFQEEKRYKFKHAYHLFPIILDKKKTKKTRDGFLFYLNKNNIGAGVNYRSITQLSYFKKNYKWNEKTCKVASYVGKNIISLPIYPDLSIKQQNYIISKIRYFFKNKN